MLTLALMLLTAKPNPVTYTCSRRPGGPCEVTDWSRAERVWTAAHDVPVYERPERTAPVTAKLRFGVPVKVLQSVSAELVTAGDRTDRWYRIASEGKGGYVFGDALSGARFEDDFDGDGDLERPTVSFTPAMDVRVRFYEPKQQTEKYLDLQAVGGAYLSMKGGHAWADAVKKSVAGLPLVHVATHVEACADLADYWVSYLGSTPRVALELSGLIDPPTVATYQVEFQPAKRRALVKRENFEQENAPSIKCTEVWTLDGGVFVPPAELKGRGSEGARAQ